jgi:membrane protease YdiL (CAAX protease family)
VGAGAYVVAFIPISLASYILDSQGLPTLRSLQPMLNGYHAITLFGLFLTGTIMEEFLYRGYLIERLTLLFGRSWPAGIVSWLLFTFVHLKFMGWVPLVEIGILTAVLTLVYLRERSVWPCVVCHGLNNALAYLIFPLLLT